MNRQVIQIDLGRRLVVQQRGYPDTAPRSLDGRIHARLCRRLGDRTFFLRGSFFGLTDGAMLSRWLEEFDPEELASWAGRFDADFNLVVWDELADTAYVVADRVGAHRLFVHADSGLVTVTSRLLDQVHLQETPALDSFGVYSLLTLLYPLDPASLLADTWVVNLGDLATCTSTGVRLASYYQPVAIETENFRSPAECIAAIDASLRETFARRISADTVPLVMLSGGIDSTLMLRYLSELAPGKVETLTFGVEGAAGELEEARIAARYYGSRHHELIIPLSDIEDLTQRALLETDYGGYGGFHAVAIADFLHSDRRSLDVFRGEDARLHTPSLDLPGLIGLLANRRDMGRLPAGKALWNLRRVLRKWPFRRGRNYLRYVVEKTELRDSLTEYVLRSLARFHLPEGLGSGRPSGRLLEVLPAFESSDSIDAVYRKVVALEYRLQHTENMHAAVCAGEVAGHTVHLPFFTPSLTAQWNRIPLSLGMRPSVTSPAKTRSPLPVVGKYVLRRLAAGHLPPELLYRRKATASEMQQQYEQAGASSMLPAIRDWGEDLLAMLDDETAAIAASYRAQLLGGADVDWILGQAGCSLFHLAAVGRLCRQGDADLSAEIADMPPWQRGPGSP